MVSFFKIIQKMINNKEYFNLLEVVKIKVYFTGIFNALQLNERNRLSSYFSSRNYARSKIVVEVGNKFREWRD